MQMRTLQQKFAEKVYQKVKAIESQQDQNYQKEYGAMALRLPVLVRQAGLIQALTFAEARGKEAHRQMLTDLAGVLGFSKEELLARAREATLGEYMYLTRQVLWALEWFKRFAQAILKVEATEEIRME